MWTTSRGLVAVDKLYYNTKIIIKGNMPAIAGYLDAAYYVSCIANCSYAAELLFF